jgi:hypothetical protein
MLESSAKRSADFQVCRAAGFQTRWPYRRGADLEVGGTAGLETCATNDLPLGAQQIRIRRYNFGRGGKTNRSTFWKNEPILDFSRIVKSGSSSITYNQK